MKRGFLAFSKRPWFLFALAIVLLAAPSQVIGQADVLTQHNDPARTGANLNETTLTPINVTASQFGMLFQRPVDDQIYSQPLVVSGVDIGGVKHNVVYVATVHNSVYAYDADDASRTAPYWHVNFGAPVSGHFSCHDFSGNYSIVGTPVIDKAANTMYVVDQTGSAFTHHLHALDISTGADKAGSPVTVNISNQLQNQRPALLLANGRVYVGLGSHCDAGSYHGLLIAYDASSLSEVGRWNSTPSGSMGSLWGSGQGPAIDSAGNIYEATSNGSFNGTSNFSESIVKLSPDLRMLDWFAGNGSDDNPSALNAHDLDLDSSSPMVIPGTSLIVSGSKQGFLYVLNTSSLGHQGGPLQRFRVSSSEVHTSVIYWNSASVGPLVYVWGTGGHLEAHRVSPSGITTAAQASGPESLGSPRTVAMISLSARNDTDGILWANALGTLRAYDATNVSNETYNSTQTAGDGCGSFSKNAPPTVANGKVYLASFSGHFCVYGLKSPLPNFSLSSTPTSQSVTPGGSTSYTITVTPSHGFTGDVTLGVTGLPAGATGSFSPNPVTGGSGSSTLSVSTLASTPPGTYTLTITGTSGSQSHPIMVTLNVTSPDFSVSVSPGSQTVTAGGSTTYTAAVTGVSGFSGTVSVNASGLPAGVTVTGCSVTLPPNGSCTLNVTTSTTTPTGPHTLTFTGTSGSVSHPSNSVTLTVNSVGGCVTARNGGGWVNTPFATQTGTFTVQFDAIPSSAAVGGHVGISHGAQTAYTGFANIVRFNLAGAIDVRNDGTGYSAASVLNYVGNAMYHVRMVIDIPTHQYSVFVTPPTGPEVPLAANFPFRTEQNTVTNLNNYGVFVAATTTNTIQVCNFTVQ
jgi:hypothetical protein